MAPRQFVFFLKWAAHFHQHLQEFYTNRCREARDPDVEELLRFLARRESKRARSIQACAEDAPHAVLGAWFKVTPDLRTVHFPVPSDFPPDASVDDVIHQAIKIDGELVRVYKMLLRQAGAGRVQDVLEDLLAQEMRDEIRLLTIQR